MKKTSHAVKLKTQHGRTEVVRTAAAGGSNVKAFVICGIAAAIFVVYATRDKTGSSSSSSGGLPSDDIPTQWVDDEGPAPAPAEEEYVSESLFVPRPQVPEAFGRGLPDQSILCESLARSRTIRRSLCATKCRTGTSKFCQHHAATGYDRAWLPDDEEPDVLEVSETDVVDPPIKKGRRMGAFGKADLSVATIEMLRARGVLNQLYIDFKNKYMYCCVPHAGCTATLSWMLKHAGIDAAGHVLEDNADLGDSIPRGDTIETETLQKVFNSGTYFKFTATRNPFKRAVDVYMKLFKRCRQALKLPPDECFQYGDALAVQAGAEFLPSDDATFLEILGMMARPAGKVGPKSAHWLPSVQVCGMDYIPYDFIGKVENLHDVSLPRKIMGDPSKAVDTVGRALSQTVAGEYSLSTFALVQKIFNATDLHQLGYYGPMPRVGRNMLPTIRANEERDASKDAAGHVGPQRLAASRSPSPGEHGAGSEAGVKRTDTDGSGEEGPGMTGGEGAGKKADADPDSDLAAADPGNADAGKAGTDSDQTDADSDSNQAEADINDVDTGSDQTDADSDSNQAEANANDVDSGSDQTDVDIDSDQAEAGINDVDTGSDQTDADLDSNQAEANANDVDSGSDQTDVDIDSDQAEAGTNDVDTDSDQTDADTGSDQAEADIDNVGTDSDQTDADTDSDQAEAGADNAGTDSDQSEANLDEADLDSDQEADSTQNTAVIKKLADHLGLPDPNTEQIAW
ncbi:hypothetical protein DIPPA_23854 [Diplonema papillatum]|nr:hypothetical protein DIPPA_23854 [Diplonema papillatum]